MGRLLTQGVKKPLDKGVPTSPYSVCVEGALTSVISLVPQDKDPPCLG